MQIRSTLVKSIENITPVAEIFIPKFEDDIEKRLRLEKSKENKQIRDKEFAPYYVELAGYYNELVVLMKEHINSIKKEIEEFA